MNNPKICPHCGHSHVVKNGHSVTQKQQMLCRNCERQWLLDPVRQPISAEKKEQVVSLLKERLSLSGICRVCKISMGWLLWFLQTLGKCLDYQAHLPDETPEIALELDEMWTFVGCKKNKFWLWIALERKSRMIVAFHVGKRDEDSCRAFWEKIPKAFRDKAIFYTDLWKAYQAVIPKAQHRPQEERGQTNYVERLNGTIRHLCSRLVRQNYAFSKKLENLIAHLNIIIEDYNKSKYTVSC